VRVLLIEDEPDLADAVSVGLRAEGYDVDVANDGDTGLWQALEHDYSVIVLDIMLPGINGYKVCRALREAGDETPILMLTAKQGVFDEAEALDTGADDFLSKPFSFVVLVARLRALLRRSGRTRAPVLRVDDLSLDPVTHECRRGETVIELTPRERSLLELLMRRADEVVSRHDLLAEVWGHDQSVDSNVLEVYIGYLRRKIDQPFDRSTLVTARGVGYRLVSRG
jgi:DNA-binding response OmpR family regulator